MTPRQSSKPTGPEITPPPQEGTPKIEAGVQGHDFHAQAVFDINRQVAKLETGLVYVEKRLDKVEVKLEQVHLDVSGAKKIAWAFGAILSIIGAIALVLLNKILDLVVAHYVK